jgi:PAS domain-containing protein
MSMHVPSTQRQHSAIATTTQSALKQLVELSPDALLVIDEQGLIVHANAAVAHLFGFVVDQILSHPLEALLPERDDRRDAAALLRIEAHDQVVTGHGGPSFRCAGVRTHLIFRERDSGAALVISVWRT